MDGEEEAHCGIVRGVGVAYRESAGPQNSDEFAVRFCRSHHRAAHRAGDERAWWRAAGIDPIKAARNLWKHTRVEQGQMLPDARMQSAEPAVALNSRATGGLGCDLDLVQP